MSYLEARNLVTKAVSNAMVRDGSSGGIMRLMNVTKDKSEREFINYSDLPIK